ncbi:Hypothetical predicted protein [Paramuricea clavata]|uniref:Uncharacterized protein n=1 Tax=Paramuricea clavata TaxID=317549 RepID=A0A7D9JA33_PARCT|nr:Hypothetical predicted protein [Paramuricea clavata]CAB4025286.1 Hypothetical predicted protein [Paramuricea clavata]
MYYQTYSGDGEYKFYKSDVSVGGKLFVIDSGKFGVLKKDLPKVVKYNVRRGVRTYVPKIHVELVCEHLVKVRQWFRDEKVCDTPGLRFLLARLCSMLSVVPKRNLRDVYPSPRCEAHEFLFYGIMVPHFEWEVQDCKYYRRWCKVVQKLCSESLEGDIIMPRFISWEEWYSMYWDNEDQLLKRGFIKCGRG